MISYTQGKPIARVENKKNKAKSIIYIDTESSNKGPTELYLNKLKEYMIPVPDIDGRQVVYIAGPSGSGKSTYAANYMKQYRKLFPKNNIFVFSRLNDDQAFKDIKHVRVPIDQNFVDDPIDIHKEFQTNDLVLFDDTDTIQSPNIKKAVSALKNDVLETGRHNNIYTLVTSHLINGNDKKDTRTILNEAHTITMFPKGGSAYAITYVLKNYLGFGKKQIDRILSLNSRWVTVGKSYPQYVLYDKGIFLL